MRSVQLASRIVRRRARRRTACAYPSTSVTPARERDASSPLAESVARRSARLIRGRVRQLDWRTRAHARCSAQNRARPRRREKRRELLRRHRVHDPPLRLRLAAVDHADHVPVHVEHRTPARARPAYESICSTSAIRLLTVPAVVVVRARRRVPFPPSACPPRADSRSTPRASRRACRAPRGSRPRRRGRRWGRRSGAAPRSASSLTRARRWASFHSVGVGEQHADAARRLALLRAQDVAVRHDQPVRRHRERRARDEDSIQIAHHHRDGGVVQVVHAREVHLRDRLPEPLSPARRAPRAAPPPRGVAGLPPDIICRPVAISRASVESRCAQAAARTASRAPASRRSSA